MEPRYPPEAPESGFWPRVKENWLWILVAVFAAVLVGVAVQV